MLQNFQSYFAEKMLANSLVRNLIFLPFLEIDAHILAPTRDLYGRFRTYSEEIHGLSEEVFPKFGRVSRIFTRVFRTNSREFLDIFT